ncbi:hypothetical protein LUZ60_010630 [Juncus effusus]|nr:hypothetical protein LUZ60_010630 [Juncus effusus]
MVSMGFFFVMIFASFVLFANGQLGDILGAGEVMYDNETLISVNKNFQLGFFNPPNSTNQYLGIWYTDPTEIVWVANGDSPSIGGNSTLSLSSDGILSIKNSNGITIWSRGKQSPKVSPFCRLVDVGTLFLLDNNTQEALWQSSSELSNTLLPTVYLGYVHLLNLDLKMQLVSWKNIMDPSSGNFVYKLDPSRLSELVISYGQLVTFRTGPWNGTRWNGLPVKGEENLLSFQYKSSPGGSYFWYDTLNPAYLLRLVMNPNGILSFLRRNATSTGWEEFETIPPKTSSQYAMCGPFGIFDGTCTYPEGFVPKSLANWKQGNFSEGCVRAEPLNCTANPGFVKVQNVKLPDTINAGANNSIMSLDSCKMGCAMNCSCTAYTVLGSQGCLAWFGDLIDIEKLVGDIGEDLYIRVTASPSPTPASKQESKMKKIIKIITYAAMPAALIALLACVFLGLKVYKWRSHRIEKLPAPHTKIRNGQDELWVIEYNMLRAATNDFCEANKLGGGQFGLVYKGVLNNGEEIAVKRLSRNSRDGIENPKKEVTLLARLKHQNLVKLLGYCELEDEILLCYEYLPNRSLDKMLFEENSLLSWTTRYNIIEGISAGLLYLHEDNGCAIIHRDIKPSNILLDRDMVPKISDFGLARLFDPEGLFIRFCNLASCGHGAPELRKMILSTNADVYSFGIIILEAVTGQRNASFSDGLIAHVLQYWNEGKVKELVDQRLRQPYPIEDIKRCVHIALLCLLEQPEMRPRMRDINHMLTSKTSSLPTLPRNCSYWGLMLIDSTTNIEDLRLF